MLLDTTLKLAQAFLRTLADCEDYAEILSQAQPNSIRGKAPLAKEDASEVVAQISEVAHLTSPKTRALATSVIDRHDKLEWWNAYDKETPSGDNFSSSTAAALLVGPGAPFDYAKGRAGFFFLRQGLTYAPHNHKPNEIYAILAGEAEFWSESDGWRTAGAGEVIHTPTWSWHGMTTQKGPILILWAWGGDGLDTAPGFEQAPNW
jgi:quercetin dioxygenase-like cupin family protein